MSIDSSLMPYLGVSMLFFSSYLGSRSWLGKVPETADIGLVVSLENNVWVAFFIIEVSENPPLLECACGEGCSLVYFLYISLLFEEF